MSYCLEGANSIQAVILLMSGFCQLRVRKKTICKRYNIIGYHKWLADAGVVASGCADTVLEGRHYCRI